MKTTATQQAIPQAIVRKGKHAYKKRVPSVLTRYQQDKIRDSFRAGRDCHQIAQSIPCAIALVLEIVLRDQEQWLRQIDIRRPDPPAAVQFRPARREAA
jgi:hypothetical protein